MCKYSGRYDLPIVTNLLLNFRATPVIGFTDLLANTGSSRTSTETEVVKNILSLSLIHLCMYRGEGKSFGTGKKGADRWRFSCDRIYLKANRLNLRHRHWLT